MQISNTAPKNVPTPTAQYKNEIGIIYNLNNCEVKIAHTTIHCTTVVGVGKDFKWQINVDNQQSLPSSSTTRYKKPVIAKVTGPGAIGSSTRGGDKFYLHGDYFGPTGPFHIDLVAYWNDAVQNVFEGLACTVEEAQKRIECESCPGVGKGFRYRVDIATQSSNIGQFDGFYAQPALFGVKRTTGKAMDDSDTRGLVKVGPLLSPQIFYEYAIVEGEHFGPANVSWNGVLREHT